MSDRQPFDGLLSRLTDNPLQRRNVFWMIVASLAMTVGAVLIAGPVFQTYLVKVGLGEGQIGVYGSVTQVASAAGLFAFMGVADRVKRRIRAAVLLGSAAALTPLVLAVLTTLDQSLQTAAVVFPVAVALVAVQSPTAALNSMVRAGLLVRTTHFNIRGRFTGIQGFLCGLLALSVGFAARSILESVGFPRGFTICFSIAIPFYLIGALLTAKLAELPELNRPGRTGSVFPWAAVWDVLRVKQFQVLMVPNALRGLGDGVLYFAWIVGLKHLNLSAEYAGLATMVNAIAGAILGTIAVALLVDRWGPGKVVFCGDALTAVALLGLVATKSPVVFFVFFGLATFGSTIMGTGVPLGTYEVAPPELMGAFSGARLIMLAGGLAISLPLVGWLLQSFDAFPVFAGGAAVKLTSAILYWHGFRRMK